MRFEFPRTLGQEPARESLKKTLDSGRFPHALLVHGEPGLGQHALLLDLAQILSCEHPEARPCGACYPCRAFASAALDTAHYLIPVVKADKEKKKGDDFEGEEDEGPESDQLDELAESIDAWHREPYSYGVAGKAMVRMSQARELIGRLRYSEASGRARVVLVPWLESLGTETANALLKTLEEPPPGVYFLIASDHRSGLMQTLLSRCSHLGLAPLPPDALRRAAETLSARVGKPLSTRLLPFAEGSPGAYLDLLENGGEELLEEAIKFLAAARSDWRVFADFAGEIPGGAEGMARADRLLLFLLRMLRAHHSLAAHHPDRDPGARVGEAGGYRRTAAALKAQGWDDSLTAYLGAFEDVADTAALATFITEAQAAIRDYSKPSIALTGLFLEYEEKAARARRPAGVAA